MTRSRTPQRFWEREHHDLSVWHRLTPRQRRQPYWQRREIQWRKAALLALMAGVELPEAVARMLDDLSTETKAPRRASGGTAWGGASGNHRPRSDLRPLP
jgi:hypothetical protein